MMRRFRFGFQLGDEPADELLDRARSAEAAGFDVLHTSDHIGGQWAPLTTLAAIGAATTRVRLCPLVVNNDFWHPVLLAREVAALDHLTDGRVELGLGAGHSFTEYDAMGLVFDLTAQGLGVRCQRFSMLIDNGVVKTLNIEAPGKYEVSGGDTMLTQLG